ncbi:hypothetical protein BDA96_06G247200 [Sorghum bicolor]|uniref:Phytocyanin domain-containing protein n=2 Tax=Sorghum bicolor TaxID=4558 RepID=A0A921UDG0_SORBI|nr:blue copper protein [Sorghum bicolor]EES11478.1 hypothetical protein SORBI_3006G225500 [Sorghum bicolor]KAG0527604.1 hypothetical protein BDA96_06G247200 [Sorghum bicolor]|eukprot:XP_002447150.1 blue copper protein [Sorghum bicolor]
MPALLVKALAALLAMAAVAELAAAKNYTIQWSVSGNYGDWSSNNAVSVGDTVVFTYGPPHTVDELPSEADYKACSFDNSVSSDQSGSTAVTFDKAGTRYFACAAASHCSQGQKVAITTAGAGASPAPKPKENSAATAMAGLAVKLALGLGVGGAVLAAF